MKTAPTISPPTTESSRKREASLITALIVLLAPLAVPAQDETQITFDPARDNLPAWSPDGERIAFVSDRSGNRDIWTIPASGGVATQLTTHAGEDTDPSWSGAQIVFGSDRSGNGDLWVIPANGGTATQITFDPAWDGDPDWSPDGTTIAFTSDRSGNREIWVMPSTGGVASQITTDGGDFPEWSPDGSQIAYLTGVGFFRSISLIPATGGDAAPLGTGALAGPLAWSPDGIVLAFSHMISGTFQRAIHTVRVAVGGEPYQETFPGVNGVDEHPAWSPDGSQIAFTRNWLCTGCSWDVWTQVMGPPISVEQKSWGSIKGQYRR